MPRREGSSDAKIGPIAKTGHRSTFGRQKWTEGPSFGSQSGKWGHFWLLKG